MKILAASLFVLATLPAAIAAPTVAMSAAPRPAPAAALFPWVPSDGYPDRFPYGQCTWWAAYNRRVTWGGDAGDWLTNAQSQCIQTDGQQPRGDRRLPAWRRIQPVRPRGHRGRPHLI